MNIKTIITTLVIAGLLFGSIWTIAQEMSYLSMINNSGFLLLLLFVPAIIGSFYAYQYVKRTFQGDDVIRYTGISFIFFLLLSQAIGLSINRMSSTNCDVKRVEVVNYQPMYVSGYGRTSSDPIANQWAISILTNENKLESYVLKENIYEDESEERDLSLKFCRSIFGFKMLKGLP